MTTTLAPQRQEQRINPTDMRHYYSDREGVALCGAKLNGRHWELPANCAVCVDLYSSAVWS